jgi:hypothetical protein
MATSSPTLTATRRRVPRSVLIAVGAWALATAAIFPLSRGTLPFYLPLFAGRGAFAPLVGVESSLVEALGLIALIVLLTARRHAPDLAARAPATALARAETLGMAGYAVVAQVGGALLGRTVSGFAISLHMPGTLYGLRGPYTPRAALIWAAYNFVAYAVAPFVYFRVRGYTREQLNLRSNNLRADVVLILVVLVVESAAELLGVSAAIFALSGRQLVLGAALAFGLNLFGTVLPAMVFIYCILLPRYLKLTNSVALTVILGGLTYAALHIGESWTDFTSLRTGVLSLIFVALQYVGPGMVKSVLTLRTGNAWVHAWAYHAFAPHVIIDTPTVAAIFHVR